MSNFSVIIDDIIVRDGLFIPLDKTKKTPKINFDRYPSEKYTIVTIDPDAPSRKNPIYKYWLHLLIINNDQKVIPYESPSPPKGSGKHRYIFYLLKQQNTINKNKLMTPNKNPQIVDNIKISDIKRNNFNFGEFMHDNNLEIVDSVYFETEEI